jgi:hypothetical protein
LAACFIFQATAVTPLAAVLPTLHWLIEFPRLTVLFHFLDNALGGDRVLLLEISVILRVAFF